MTEDLFRRWLRQFIVASGLTDDRVWSALVVMASTLDNEYGEAGIVEWQGLEGWQGHLIVHLNITDEVNEEWRRLNPPRPVSKEVQEHPLIVFIREALLASRRAGTLVHQSTARVAAEQLGFNITKEQWDAIYIWVSDQPRFSTKDETTPKE